MGMGETSPEEQNWAKQKEKVDQSKNESRG